MELNQEQTVKALELCLANSIVANKCVECPYLIKGDACMDCMLLDALDIIRELTEEKEHWKKRYEESESEYVKAAKRGYAFGKADTVRKMWARLKEKAEIVSTYGNPTMVDLDDINQIAKELLGETEC